MKIAYIQVQNGEFINQNCYASWEGFSYKGYDVRKFQFFELRDLELTGPDTVVHGKIPSVKGALRLLGVAPPSSLRVPKTLSHYLGRNTWESTLGELRRVVGAGELEKPIFVKPLASQKAFTGHVVRRFADLIASSGCDDSLEVEFQDEQGFLSEWRAFVLRGEILNVSHYKGDPLIFPTTQVVKRFVQEFEASGAAPVAYSADFGVVDYPKDMFAHLGWQTRLVEVNDSFALGSYGLPTIDYADMIEARWQQMCRSSLSTPAPARSGITQGERSGGG